MDCPMCKKSFDLESRRAKTLPCGHTYCKTCLRRIVDAPDEPLPELPQEMLLHVFRWLPLEDLLRGPRAVSRSWRQAALHPALWRHREIDNWSKQVVAVLRLASRLDSLILRSCGDDSHMGALEAATSTDCAVTTLHLDVYYEDKGNEVKEKVLQTVRRQIELGRLKGLTISVRLSEAADVIRLVADAGLTDLDLTITGEGPVTEANYPKKAEMCSLLETLRYECDQEDPWFQSLVSSHSATLESVTAPSWVTSGAVEELGRCPRLHDVQLIALPEVAALSACPLLRELSLVVEEDASYLVPYFRGATRLTKLTFPFLSDSIHDSAVDLVAALASSGRSQLKELVLDTFLEDATALLPLPRVLEGLPLLHSLHLRDLPPTSSLDAITPLVAPHLRVLGFVRLDEEYTSPCKWGVCSFPPLFRLVQRNPQVHVVGLPAQHRCPEDWGCGCCEAGLHPVSTAESETHCCLYGHEPSEDCQVKAHTQRPLKCTSCFFCRCSPVWIFIEAGSGKSRDEN